MHRPSGGWEAVTRVRAVGIDPGSKILDAVVLEATGHVLRVVDVTILLPLEERRLTDLCSGAAAIAIDAPSDLSTALHASEAALPGKFRTARCGEIALRADRGCSVQFATPTDLAAASSWMQEGFRLWQRLRDRGHVPIEVYPYGAFTALAGRRLPKKQTAEGAGARVDVLARYIELPASAGRWSHDTIDAAVAALMAAWCATDGPVMAARHDHEGEDGSAIWMPA